MDLYQLRYFLEVARELNFSRAAAGLHLSPSAVSRSIAALEASVGKRLFARTKRQVALTVSGEALKERAERIFDEVERASVELAGEAAAPARLRIASRELITNYLLPRPLAEFQARYPGTRFGLFFLEPRAMVEALKKDRVDLGLYYADIRDPALESRRLGSLRSHVYASRKLGLQGAGQPFIAPRSFEGDPSSPSPDGFPDHRLSREVRYEAESLETHRRFVLEGLCVGVLPDLAAREQVSRRELVVLKGPSMRREIYCFRRKGRAVSKAVEFLLGAIRKAVSAGESRSARAQPGR